MDEPTNLIWRHIMATKKKTNAQRRQAKTPAAAVVTEPKPKKSVVINYDAKPADQCREPRAGTKAAKVIALLRRSTGATAEDIQTLLNDIDGGARNNDLPYARTWVQESWLFVTYGFGIRTELKNDVPVYFLNEPTQAKTATA